MLNSQKTHILPTPGDPFDLQDLYYQITRLPQLLCGIVFMTMFSRFSITPTCDRHMDTQQQHM